MKKRNLINRSETPVWLRHIDATGKTKLYFLLLFNFNVVKMDY